MIKQIWWQIFSIVALIVIPLMAVEYASQKASIELVFALAEKTSASGLADAHLALLKKASQLDPAHEADYRKEFETTAETKITNTDLKTVREHLIEGLLSQALRNTGIVLLISLLITHFIARGIVVLFQRLLDENQKQSKRLERLSSLESWQNAARMMVHEMRAPVTPIRLVATDIERKYEALEPAAFSAYLREGAALLRSQTLSIERLTDSLTKFARLPEVQRSEGSIIGFLNGFVEAYRDYGDGRVRLTFQRPAVFLHGVLLFDAGLLRQLFFNLLKNAHEANADRAIDVSITITGTNERVKIDFHNTGAAIPAKVGAEMFKMHVSSKSDQGTNFGLGLTIAQKIALDHQGDLYLSANDAEAGVAFRLELPVGES